MGFYFEILYWKWNVKIECDVKRKRKVKIFIEKEKKWECMNQENMTIRMKGSCKEDV